MHEVRQLDARTAAADAEAARQIESMKAQHVLYQEGGTATVTEGCKDIEIFRKSGIRAGFYIIIVHIWVNEHRWPAGCSMYRNDSLLLALNMPPADDPHYQTLGECSAAAAVQPSDILRLNLNAGLPAGETCTASCALSFIRISD